MSSSVFWVFRNVCFAAPKALFWGAFVQHESQQNAQNLQTIVQWFAQGKLKAQIHGQYTLENVKKAMYAMVNKEVKGKIVLIPS